MTESRGVSDLIGFVLTFSLIILMVGLVYSAGISEIQAARNAEHANNAERAFSVLGENIDDLVHQGVPSRATSVRLSGSNIQYGDRVKFNLTFTSTDTSYIATIDPVVYRLEGGPSIVYSNGAVIRDQREGGVMIDDPPFVFGSRTIVPFIMTRGSGGSKGGQTTVLVRTTLASRKTFAHRPAVSGDVRLTINSSRAAVWADYIESESGGTCTVAADGQEATCTLSPDSAYVPLAKIDVMLI